MGRALISSAVLFLAVVATAAAGHRPSMNVSIDNDREVRSCDDIRVSFDERPAEVSENTFTIPGGKALALDLPANSGIHVVGSDRSDYSVTACKAARRRETLEEVRVSPDGSGIALHGPSSGEWLIHLIVRAPKSAPLDLEASNGPIDVRGMTGRVVVRTTNGPIGISESSGEIQANAQNGPISLEDCSGSGEARAVNGPVHISGRSGTYKLSTQNGPISVNLEGDRWDGTLDARAVNGPLSLKLEEGYRSGVLLEATGHGPVSCPDSACRSARKTFDDDARRIEFGDSEPVVRLSTRNGPVSVKVAD
jgi:hypothetical protein